MRILFYCKKSPWSAASYGGAESSMRLVAEKLSDKGHEVFFIASKNGLSMRFTKKNNIQLIEVPKSTLQITVLLSVLFYRIPVAYCYYEELCIRHLVVVKKCFGRPKIIVRMAGLHWYEKIQKKKKMKPMYEKAFSKIDVFNFIHADLIRMTEEKSKELGASFQFNRIFIGDIGTSAPIGRSTPYALGGRPFKMIMAARFSTYQKRQDLLILALNILDRSRDIHMTLFGEGEMKSYIQKMIKERDLHDKVTIRGFSPQENLWDEMRKSDLLCHAAEYEGLGKAIIESMALGLPVLASNVAPLNAYIQDGENGFLVDNTPDAWANKIAELLDNKNLLNRVSRRSIEYIEKYYNPENNIVTYENEFMRLAAYK